jgi:wyosine [tRNA(Phe)-imidazoG37] synthetase (radical SAM superfamily)
MPADAFVQCSLFRSDEPRLRLAGRLRVLSDRVRASGACQRQFLLVPDNERAAADTFVREHGLSDLEVLAGPHHPFTRFCRAVRQTGSRVALRFGSSGGSLPAPILADMVDDHVQSGMDVTFPRTLYYDGPIQCQVANADVLERVEVSPLYREEAAPSFLFPLEAVESVSVNQFEPRAELLAALPDFPRRVQDPSRFPVMLKIDPSEACNLRCNMCHFHAEGFALGDGEAQDYYRDHADQRNLKGTLSEGQFETILGRLAGFALPSIDLYGNGEPFVNRSFVSFLARLAGLGKTISVSSNGNLLTDDAIDAVLDSGVAFLSFSLDALCRETYRRIRIGGDIERVERNIHRLLERRSERRSRLKVAVNLTLQDLNAGEADGFVEKWLAAVDQVDVVHYYAAKRYPLAKNWTPRARTLCHQSYVNLATTVRGELWVCIGGHHFESTLGNIFEKDLAAILSDGGYRDFQRSHFEGRPDSVPMCQGCEVWMKDLRRVHYSRDRVVEVGPVTRTYRKRQ